MAACILSPTFIGIWLSTEAGMVLTHQSARTVRGAPPSWCRHR